MFCNQANKLDEGHIFDILKDKFIIIFYFLPNTNLSAWKYPLNIYHILLYRYAPWNDEQWAASSTMRSGQPMVNLCLTLTMNSTPP